MSELTITVRDQEHVRRLINQVSGYYDQGSRINTCNRLRREHLDTALNYRRRARLLKRAIVKFGDDISALDEIFDEFLARGRTADRLYEYNLSNATDSYRNARAYKRELQALNDSASNRAVEIARARQQLAAARCKPDETNVLTCEAVLAACQSHPNVFGANVNYNDYHEQIRVELAFGGLVMSEASEPDEYPDIRLPEIGFSFYISKTGDVRYQAWYGYRRQGYSALAIHPHWLSDGPCLGSFAQSMQDVMQAGQFDVWLSLMVAFLCQYNLPDSAGATAPRWNPSSCQFEAPDYAQLPEFSYFDEELRERFKREYQAWYDTAKTNPIGDEDDEHHFNCEDCGRREHEDDGRWYADRHVCERCAEDYCGHCDSHYQRCECVHCSRCGDVCTDDAVYVERAGEDYCYSCLDRLNYMACEHCSEFDDNCEEVATNGTNQMWCEPCRDQEGFVFDEENCIYIQPPAEEDSSNE